MLLPVLQRTGCLFVTTAVESVDDRVLAILDKGHTREDFFQVVRLFDEVGLSLSPTFVAFTPWTTLDGYLDLLKVIAGAWTDPICRAGAIGDPLADSTGLSPA